MSLSGALLGVVNEVVWVAYAVHQGLWSAAPEAVLMTASNGVLVVWLRRGGAGWRRAARAAGAWAAALAVVAVLGGPAAVGVVLGAAYGVQVAPAVWTAWRTASPTGVAAATWAFVVVESLLWGAYGLHHADPATSVLAVVGALAGSAMLLRKLVTRHRPLVLMAR